jgi:hypothetical protein
MVRWATRRSRLNVVKAKGSKIKLIDEDFDDPNRVIFGHVVVKRPRQ